MSSGTRIVT
uniref:Uncharacterized protein n=1 Tax=Oryza punctata TaxID=4537 RepID=A0A0G2KBQ0_ORYPU